MKIVILAVSFLYTISPLTDLDRIRAAFKLAPKSEKEADKLIEIISPLSNEKKPVFQAYLGALTTMKASWAFWPHQKLDFVGKGMKLLNTAVKTEPGNLEIRWLRFSVETQMPSFLGYDHQKADRAIVYSLLKTELYQKQMNLKWVREIAAYMKIYGSPDAEEQKVLNIYLH